MNRKDNIFADILDEDELNDIKNDTTTQSEDDEQVSYVVYYVDDKPDTVWQYFHNPKDLKPHAKLHGYWATVDNGKNKRSEFHEHHSKNRKIMSFDHLVEHIVPDKDSMKVFEFEEEFFIEFL